MGQSMQQQGQPPRLEAHQKLQLAVEAGVHPRTVDRALRGQAVRSTVAARLRKASTELGFPLPELKIASGWRP